VSEGRGGTWGAGVGGTSQEQRAVPASGPPTPRCVVRFLVTIRDAGRVSRPCLSFLPRRPTPGGPATRSAPREASASHRPRPGRVRPPRVRAPRARAVRAARRAGRRVDAGACVAWPPAAPPGLPCPPPAAPVFPSGARIRRWEGHFPSLTRGRKREGVRSTGRIGVFSAWHLPPANPVC
jgi:hypothetical protein